MKDLFILSTVLLAVVFSTFAQSNLNDYSFVVVPENFEFTSEKDQFQLNSMTKYYLNEHGFNAFFQSELPRVNNCDGLYAEVVSKGSFVTTTAIIYLKDCEGTVLFESQEGRSKKKEYRQAYQESLRDAFKSIERLNISQTAIVVDSSASNVDKAAAKRITGARLKIDAVPSENQTVAKAKRLIATDNSFDGPLLKFSYFKKGTSAYLLRKSKTGYSFYIEDESDSIGLILLGSLFVTSDDMAYSIKGQVEGLITFSENGDLILKESDTLEVFKLQN
jgi:hypothetical protein